MTKINLRPEFFTETRRVLAESGELRAEAFRYSTGVAALKVSNRRGSFTILPFMGQMVWRCDFDGRELTMKSIFDEPRPCHESFGESYGCFLMHCGMTAMGNPTAADSHPPHGELPFAPYGTAWIEAGRDQRGEYFAVGGTYTHMRCFSCHHDFIPRVLLHVGATALEIETLVRNQKDLPLEYYYLCHVNHRPVDGSRIVEPPVRKPPIVNHEVPPGYFPVWAEATKIWLSKLDEDPTQMNEIGAAYESYRPEIVTCHFHKPDRKGWAKVSQNFPDGTGSVYVRYRPCELPYATRWIARTADEDALGMCLPATAEHKGLAYCRAHGQQRVLEPGEHVMFHVVTGLETP